MLNRNNPIINILVFGNINNVGMLILLLNMDRIIVHGMYNGVFVKTLGEIDYQIWDLRGYQHFGVIPFICSRHAEAIIEVADTNKKPDFNINHDFTKNLPKDCLRIQYDDVEQPDKCLMNIGRQKVNKKLVSDLNRKHHLLFMARQDSASCFFNENLPLEIIGNITGKLIDTTFRNDAISGKFFMCEKPFREMGIKPEEMEVEEKQPAKKIFSDDFLRKNKFM